MKVCHSDSLLLIWRLSEFEARHLRAAVIDPPHLLLGLCKAVDVDLLTLVRMDSLRRDEILEEWLREIRRLREIFVAVRLDARAFRRAYRKQIARRATTTTNRLRRSEPSKRVFAGAERFAGATGAMVFPIHLLHATLSIDDPVRDEEFKKIGAAIDHLRRVVQYEVIFPWTLGPVEPGCN